MATYPDDPTMRVSHETIYCTLYVQTRGTLKKELLAHLRRRQRRRQSRAATKQGEGRGRIVDAVSISERPPTVEDRAVPGHWEGDLLAGAKNSHIATLVERHSRYVHLVKVAGKDTESVVTALLREGQRLPTGLMASLTWDRGTELAQHQLFSMVSDVAVYFCDPHSPWQRGSNENTNGLLRQYFPHGTDLRPFTQRQLDAVARQLNTRPRQTLGWKTPATGDALFLLAMGAIIFVVATVYDLPPILLQFGLDYADWEADDVIFVVFMLSVGSIIYGFRRYRDLSSEINARIRAESEARKLEIQSQILRDLGDRANAVVCDSRQFRPIASAPDPDNCVRMVT
jgi:hypothetical protein